MTTPQDTVEMESTRSSDSIDEQQELFSVADYHENKVVVERILGAILLVAAAPAIAVIVALVRITSSGSGIYKQIRLGKDGREFSIYKIRTMYQNAEESGTPQWATPGDSRITPIGRLLRFLHLDELPQLANVALGQMSLIGPRPERPEFVSRLAQSVPNYLDRLAVLPGVTGLAQINLPADDSLESVRQKVVLDREYIQRATLGLDLRIFCCTLFRMTGLRHGVAPRIFGVECDPQSILSYESACGDTVELTGSLDDTAINIPALISGSSYGRNPTEQSQVAYATEPATSTALSAPSQSNSENLSPRRPR